MLVGEQPGDREDLAGHPFVGPAGRVLDQGLAEAGIAREDVYLTNVVKHFRYKLRGKRRIHQRPDRWQVTACLPWLSAELEAVSPELVVCLGAVAGQALLGPSLRVGARSRASARQRSRQVRDSDHTPSAILRTTTEQDRATSMEAFVSDLRIAAAWLQD
jgi:DNA polymerase